MNGLNNAFFFVTEKLIEIQGYFIGMAWSFGRVVFLIALLSAALNYVLTGQGLKENIIKLLKATLFFIIIIGVYPSIISWITRFTYNAAYGAVGAKVHGYVNATTSAVRARAEQLKNESQSGTETYGAMALTDENAAAAAKAYASRMNALKANPDANYFGEIVATRGNGKISYTVVVPAAALQSMLMVAGECIRAANESPPKKGFIDMPDIGMYVAGYLCAFFVMFTGCFAVLEYLLGFLEFIFITSVGVILFPMSMWDGSKFLTEKLISAIIGFSIKLLFCTLCIFLLLYGMLSLASGYIDKPFMGLVDQILMIVFTCLLFFYICKSAPGLAQSLLTGAPSLNAAGAIGAAASAVGAVAGVAGLAAHGAANVAGGAVNAIGAGAKAVKAGSAAGGGLKGAGAALKSLGGSAGGALLSGVSSGAGGLARSLISKSPLMPRNGAGGGFNRNSAAQQFMQANKNGSQKTAGDFIKQNFDRGANPGEYKVLAGDGRNQQPAAAAPAPAAASTTTSIGNNAGGVAARHHASTGSYHSPKHK